MSRFPTRPSSVLGILFCVLVVSVTRAQSPTFDVKDRLAVVDRIYSIVQQSFAHWEGASRASVEKAYHQYIDEATKAADRRAFDLASLRFFASLHNGHS